MLEYSILPVGLGVLLMVMVMVVVFPQLDLIRGSGTVNRLKKLLHHFSLPQR